MPEHSRLQNLPLPALRAFEATARHGSMSGGAAELNVTHGAVSRQIASLERLVGCAVFERGARGVRWAAAGEQLFGAVHSGFDRMRAGLRDAGRPQAPVRLTTLPSFATRWLLPRLIGFQGEHPEIDVRVHTSVDLTDLSQGQYDLAVRYGRGSWPGLAADLLLHGTAYPVCSPEFLSRMQTIESAADLLRVPLIHNSATGRWADWFEENGVVADLVPRGLVVDDDALALEYAMGGYGVALGREALVHEDVVRGRLVRPVASSLSSRFSYYLVHAIARPLADHGLIFATWLLAAAREEEERFRGCP